MKQGLDLNAMGLVPMDQLEMQNLDGGFGPVGRWIIRNVWGYIAKEAGKRALPEYNRTLINLGPSAMDAAVMFN